MITSFLLPITFSSRKSINHKTFREINKSDYASLWQFSLFTSAHCVLCRQPISRISLSVDRLHIVILEKDIFITIEYGCNRPFSMSKLFDMYLYFRQSRHNKKISIVNGGLVTTPLESLVLLTEISFMKRYKGYNCWRKSLNP